MYSPSIEPNQARASNHNEEIRQYMIPINLRNIQLEIAEWSRKNFGDQPSYRPLLGSCEEIGELCHAHLKDEQKIRTNEDHRAAKKDAIGDILIYLLDYADRESLSVEECLIETWNRVKLRDWTKKKESGV